MASKSAFLALYAPSLNYWITNLISSLVISWGTSWSYPVAWFFPLIAIADGPHGINPFYRAECVALPLCHIYKAILPFF
jgi:hypothetical protein